MIVVYHHRQQVETIDFMGKTLSVEFPYNIAKQLFQLAQHYPDELLIWCDVACQKHLNTEAIPNLFHHKRMLHSYGIAPYLSKDIGFVENSPFIKVNRAVQYPTWQMCALVGGIHGSILRAIDKDIVKDADFDYFLNSLAKLLIPLGVFCYHSPGLLKKPPVYPGSSASTKTLFRFVKQHYKTRWVVLLFLNLWYHKRKFPLGALLLSLFYKRRNLEPRLLDSIPLESSMPFPDVVSVDVIIPTIGRTPYVITVINDLAKQTLLPKKVIVVEQNPDVGSSSELKTTIEKTWPFEIQHIFTHKTGACHARNLALKYLTADWLFLADDDLELEITFLSDATEQIKKTGIKALTVSCLQKHEKEKHTKPLQWNTFGSGCSIVETTSLYGIQFDEALEHGYGEDADFGMQLRNKGVDIIYVPEPSILHLKAPMGGFRTKPVLPWHQESIAPKPSPTIMRFHQKHRTQEQILGYKTSLFLKYYRKQPIKNPLKYYKLFKKQWNKSVFWAEKLAGLNLRR